MHDARTTLGWTDEEDARMAMQTQEPGTTEATTPAAAGEDFPQVTDPYRRELLAHCYRMTGSVHDAEDLVQETYLRAWRAYHGFEGRSSVRTWLYRIATNVCLTALEGRARRPLPAGLGAPSSEGSAPLEQNGEIPWLEPVPDAVLDGDPASVVTDRDTIRLAFVAALQHLPARQRAVLILRDVLRWRAAEVAEALETTTASVNSALQRAHATLEKAALTEDTVLEPSPEQKELLDRYVQAFWDKDIETIVSMLTKDAIWEMPPFTGWYQGAENIGRLIDKQCPGGRHDMRMLPTRANGQPAFGLYMRAEDDTFRPFHLQVLTLGPGGVRHVGAFFDASLFARFGLPESLPADVLPS
jgi:RNA polymerase sigma-70 factor, ECF subfamily